MINNINEDKLIEVSNLCKSYQNFKLNNISLTINKGDIVGLIGNNGSGKTTIIKSIMGLIRSEGDIRYAKHIKIGYIGENKSIYPNVKARVLKDFIRKSYGSNWQEEKY